MVKHVIALLVVLVFCGVLAVSAFQRIDPPSPPPQSSAVPLILLSTPDGDILLVVDPVPPYRSGDDPTDLRGISFPMRLSDEVLVCLEDGGCLPLGAIRRILR